MIPVLIFDPSFQYIGQLDDYEYLKWHRKWRRPSNFEIQINRYKNNVDKLAKGNFVVVKRGGKFRGGRISDKQIGLDENGKLSENWQIIGQSISGQFAQRLALNLIDTGSGYDEQSGDAEALMRHYVDVNCISTADPARVVPFLQLGTYLARGPAVEYRARLQTIADVLEDLSLASGLGYETEVDLTNGQFIFNVLEGRDLTPGQSVNPPVIFSSEFGNIKTLGYKYTESGSSNVAYVAGQGEGAARTIVSVSEGTKSGFDRREVLVDARDLQTTSQLTQRGNEKLAEMGIEIVMEAEHLDGGPFVYLEDFDLGDIVHAVDPGIVSMDSRIVEIVEETDVKGDKFKLVFGKEWPDLISVMSREQNKLSAEVRR